MRGSPRTNLGRVLRTAAAAAMVVVTIGVVQSVAAPLSPATGSSLFATARTSEKGLHIFSIGGRRYGVFTAIHVLTFNRSQFKVEIGIARHVVDGGLQTPSAMCRSTAHCVAAVNGDFFDMTNPHQPDPGDEVGGIIQDCVLLHTPEVAHQQADLDAESVAKSLNWRAMVYVNGLSVPITAINQERPMIYANVHLPLSGTLLYTALYALRTPSATGRFTYEFTQVDRSTSPTTINSTAELKFVAWTARPLRVSAGHVDISAPMGSRLATLRVGDTVIMTTISSSGCDSIGGHPVLINHGLVAPIDPADSYMVKPYARTVIGWTASGETVIMTVDGEDEVAGATAHQLVSLLQSLRVVTALDLDGGNSTTLYAGGHVLNHPSHGTQRPVSTGLLVVQNP